MNTNLNATDATADDDRPMAATYVKVLVCEVVVVLSLWALNVYFR